MAEVKSKSDEYWIARIQYWPHGEKKTTIIKVFWVDGDILFYPFNGGLSYPVWAVSCASFELLERIEMEKYE